MTRRSRSFGLLSLLPSVFLLAGCANYTTAPASTAAQTGAYVYVNTSPATWEANPSLPPSILAFSAAANGTFAPVQNMPLAEQEQMVAATGTSVYTVDFSSIYQRNIQPGGALTAPSASVNTQSYGGAQCGSPSGAAVLDRTGQLLTVELTGAYTESGGDYFNRCDTWQTYKVPTAAGFVFEGFDDSDPYTVNDGGITSLNISTVSGNNRFAYGIVDGGFGDSWSMMTRNTAGVLTLNQQFTYNSSVFGPSPAPQESGFSPYEVSADSSRHLAAVVYQPNSNNPAYWYAFWLASYTIDETAGSITSTNTYANMPQLAMSPATLAMSPAGDLVAVGGVSGLQVFHFNGADPPTPNGGVLLPDLLVEQVAWDQNHHLYALAQTSVAPPGIAQFSLHVFTVTASGISETSGSPWKVQNANKLIVVPQP